HVRGIFLPRTLQPTESWAADRAPEPDALDSVPRHVRGHVTAVWRERHQREWLRERVRGLCGSRGLQLRVLRRATAVRGRRRGLGLRRDRLLYSTVRHERGRDDSAGGGHAGWGVQLLAYLATCSRLELHQDLPADPDLRGSLAGGEPNALGR